MSHDHKSSGRRHLRAETRRTGKTRNCSNNRWKAADGPFRCVHCGQMVFPDAFMGTAHRNHCPYCLHSLHVDTRPGNRAVTCHARMEPVGLTYKHNGFDKYGRERSGDIMIVHVCAGCGAININRIAADDMCSEILDVFARSLHIGSELNDLIETAGIRLLRSGDADQLQVALFGRKVPA